MDEAGMSCNEVAQMGWSKKGTRCHATRSGLSSRPMSFIGTISLAEKLNLSCLYYLKAVVGANKGENDLMFENLRKATTLDAKWKTYAKGL